jgi:hypothetical protein
MHGEEALSPRSIRVVAITVQSDVSESDLVWQPLLRPKHARLLGITPCFPRSTKKAVYLFNGQSLVSNNRCGTHKYEVNSGF